MNAGNPADVKPLRRGYNNTQNQEEARAKLNTEVAGLRVKGAGHLYPFQNGLLIGVRAENSILKNLQHNLRPETYLLIRRLSQDRLETFFSLVRSGGGASTDPTSTEATFRRRS